MPTSVFNWFSPFGIATRYYGPPSQGLLTFAHSDSSPIYQNEDDENDPKNGQIIKFDEAFGSTYMQLAYLDPKNNYQGRGVKYKEMQVGANIDWVGKTIVRYFEDETQQGADQVFQEAKEPLTVSYWGPQARQLPSASFNYGDDEKHNEIYMNGFYLDVAPHPVLGAAIYKPTEKFEIVFNRGKVDENKVEYEFCIVVVCLDTATNTEIVYYRPCNPYALLVKHDKMDQDVRDGRKKLVDDQENPQGWVEVDRLPMRAGYSDGVIDNWDATKPSTPWFFNETGNAAVAIRYGTADFDNNNSETITEENVPVGYVLLVHERTGTITAEFDTIDSYDPYTWKEWSSYGQFGDDPYVHNEPDPPYDGYDHYWDWEVLKQYRQLDGERIYFLDWEEDDMLVGVLHKKGYRSNIQHFFKGVDNTVYDGSEPGINMNTGDLDGPPEDTVAKPWSDESPLAKSWIGYGDWMHIKVYRVLHSLYSLTVDQELPDRNFDIYWCFDQNTFEAGYQSLEDDDFQIPAGTFTGWNEQIRYPYYIDIRYGLYVAKEVVTKSSVLGSQLQVIKYTSYVYNMEGYLESGDLVDADTKKEWEENETLGSASWSTSALPSDGLIGIDYTYWTANLEDTQFEEGTEFVPKFERHSLIGDWVDANDNESEYAPNIDRFYDTAFYQYNSSKHKNINEVLFQNSDDLAVSGAEYGFGVSKITINDQEETIRIISFKVETTNQGTQYVNDKKDIEFGVLRSGDRYYPIYSI